MKISVCIISKNEEKYIKKCIESVYALAYEIIVLDTGSTDKTKEIAKEFDKVKLFETTWKDDFSLARNECISYASCDWILSIDADEILSSPRKNIIDIISKYDTNTIFRFKFISLLKNNQEKSYFKDSLFPNNKNLRFFRPIHEQLAFTDMNIVRFENIIITHFGELEEDKKLLEKKLKYIDKMEKLIEISNELDKIHYFRHLGDTYSDLEQNNKAIDNYFKAYTLLINSNLKDTEDCNYVLQGLLTNLLLSKSYIDSKFIEHAIKFNESHLNYLVGSYFITQKNNQKAIYVFKEILEKPIDNIFKSKVLLQLGKIESKISYYRALKYLLEAEGYAPSNLEVIQEILKIYLNQDNLPKATEYFLKLNPNTKFRNELLETSKKNRNDKMYKKMINDLKEFLLKLEN